MYEGQQHLQALSMLKLAVLILSTIVSVLGLCNKSPKSNPPSIEVQTAIKVISEGKDNSKVTKATLIKLVEYLFEELDLTKKNDLKVEISSAEVTTSKTKTTHSEENQTSPPIPNLLTKEGTYDTD